MKKITTTLLALFIVPIYIAMQGCSVHEPPPYQSKMVYDNGGSTLYTHEIWRLIGEFIHNEVAANQKYMGKRVAVDGLISSISSSSNGDPALTLRDAISGDYITCHFPKSFINDIAKMSYRHYIIAIGTPYDSSSSYSRRTGSSTWTLYLKDCILAQPALF